MNLEANLSLSVPRLKGEEPRVSINDVTWQDYLAIGVILGDRPSLRLTYAAGGLEIMTTSPEHERLKRWLSRIVETLAEEFGLEVATCGNMTFQREDLDRALEPDDSFWIANERHMRTREEWNAETDPPPDLVLEIEISRSATDRMRVYAALGVSEVWRCDGAMLRVHLLQPDGSYLDSETSPTFPGLPIAELIVYLQPLESMSYFGMVQAVRQWVRQHRASS